MTNRKKIWIILGGIIVIGVIASMVALKTTFIQQFSTKNDEAPRQINSQQREKVGLSKNSNIVFGLVDIALEKKYFEELGLDMEITSYDVAKIGFDKMLEGTHDFCVVAQTPVALASFERKDFKILTSVSSTNNSIKIVARKDKKIIDKKDLIGKKVSAPKGTGFERFLHVFLDKNAIDIKEIKKESFNNTKAAELLLSGELDAIVAIEPNVSDLMNKLGEKGIIFTEPGLLTVYSPLCVRDEYLKQHPLVAEKILLALNKANDFIGKNKSEAEQILTKYNKTDLKSIQKMMDDIDLGLLLSQGIILTLGDEAKYLMEAGLTSKKTMPNFSDIIEEKPLKKLLPQKVNIAK